MTCEVLHGDCLAVLRTLPDNSVDSIVTDPPYGLSNTDPKHVAETLTKWVTGDHEYTPPAKGGFMGKTWDSFVPPPAVWEECMRVLKPGGHMAVFAGSRTQDLMGLSIRLAGFELRDSLAWVHSQGFPKSMDVSKAIDKAAGAEREVVGHKGGRYNYAFTENSGAPMGSISPRENSPENKAASGAITAPATPEAERWAGWGTALKPAIEPILCARKPLAGTVAGNVLEWGTGALNIDASRVATDDGKPAYAYRNGPGGNTFSVGEGPDGTRTEPTVGSPAGRWPANVLLDPEAAAAMDQQSGPAGSNSTAPGSQGGGMFGNRVGGTTHDTRDAGGASRFFHVFKYQAKAPKRERPVIERPPMLQLRDDLTPEQVDHVRARLQEVGIEIE